MAKWPRLIRRAEHEEPDDYDHRKDRTLPAVPHNESAPWYHMLPLEAAAELEAKAEMLARLSSLQPKTQKRVLEFVVTHLEEKNGVQFDDVPDR